MKSFKFLLAVILLFFIFIGIREAQTITNPYIIGAERDPCGSPEAVYEAVWTGEHVSGEDYFCIDSGAGKSLGTDSGSVGTAGTTMQGAYFGTLNSATDYLELSATMPTNIATLDSEGTIEIYLKTSATLNNQILAEIYNTGSNHDDDNITLYYLVNEDIRGRHEGDVTSFIHTIANAITASGEFWIQYTWSVSGGKHCLRVCDDEDCNGEAWDCDSQTLEVFGDNADRIVMGDTTTLLTSGTETDKVDDFIVRNGYEGT